MRSGHYFLRLRISDRRKQMQRSIDSQPNQYTIEDKNSISKGICYANNLNLQSCQITSNESTQNNSPQTNIKKEGLDAHYEQNYLREQIKHEPINSKKEVIENGDLRNKTDVVYNSVRFDYNWPRPHITQEIIAEKNELSAHYQQNRLEEHIKNEPVDSKKHIIENEDLRNKTDLGYNPLRFDYHWTRQDFANVSSILSNHSPSHYNSDVKPVLIKDEPAGASVDFETYNNYQLPGNNVLSQDVLTNSNAPKTFLDDTTARAQNAEQKRRWRQSRQSNESPEEAARRRAQEAENARRRRQQQLANETPKEAVIRRTLNNTKVKLRRLAIRTNQTPEETALHLACHAEKQRNRRQLLQANETPRQAELRRAKLREEIRLRRQIQRSRETPEEGAMRRAQHAEAVRRRRQAKRENETPEEASLRRAKHAEEVRIRRLTRRLNETPEQAAMRRAQHAEEARQRRLSKLATESPEEALIRRAQHAEMVRQRRRLQRETETPESAAARRAIQAEQMRRWRHYQQRRPDVKPSVIGSLVDGPPHFATLQSEQAEIMRRWIESMGDNPTIVEENRPISFRRNGSETTDDHVTLQTYSAMTMSTESESSQSLDIERDTDEGIPVKQIQVSSSI